MADRLTEEMIDAYLDGELSLEQATELERRLAHDPHVHHEYAAVVSFLREPPQVELPASLAGRVKAAVHEQMFVPPAVRRRQQWMAKLRVAAIAASVGLVIGAGFTWQSMRTTSQHSVEPPALAAKEPTPVVLSPWMLAAIAQAANTGNPVQLAPSLIQAMAAELVLSPVEARMTGEPPTLRPAENTEPASASEPKPRWLPVFPPVQRL